MRKLIILYTLHALLRVTAGIPTTDEAYEATSEQFMQNARFPKPGDIPVLNRKIFKGQRVSIREHPYVASVRRMVSHYVIGALLTKNLVVTVAHPLHEVPITELSVVVGENYSDRGTALLTVVLIIIHEDFDPYTLKNDIALLRFYEDIYYKGNIKWISLISPSASLAGQKAFLTGWGRCDNMGTELCLDRSSKYYPDEKMDPMLRTVTFTMSFPNNYCEAYKRHEVTLFPGMLCTGVAREDDQVCPCLGLPGALLVAGARLTGLLSWGFGCGYSNDLPLIYTNMQYFSSWITHNIKIMRVMTQNNLTALFKATKAAILSQWLIETRIITPKLDIRMDKNLELMSIDQEITKLRGSVYDVRDYVADGAFHEEKAALYYNLRTEYHNDDINSTAQKTVTLPVLIPFITNKTLHDVGFNTSNIYSNIKKQAVKTNSSDFDEVHEYDDSQEHNM